MFEMPELDALLLARIQFAFTISFHIIFPAFTIGLASWLAVVEAQWLRTKDDIYKDIYKFWVKIFAVAFGLGVVSGVVMSYQFGTNWSEFSRTVASVIGPLLGYEVLTAFFLEASFLGVMIFGWGRVGPKMHFASTIIVAIGTLVSAFWILAANSWMQTPAGHRIGEDGLLYPVNWLEIIFNPSFPYRFAHMVVAAYLATAFAVGGVGAWYLLGRRHIKPGRIMLGMAMLMAVFLAPLQLVIGDLHGLNTLEHQPAKIAALEAQWETREGAAFTIIGLPDMETATTKYAVEIPHGLSLLLTHDWNGKVLGLEEWPRELWPPVPIVFWSFRVMVAIGLLMILTGITAAIMHFRGTLFKNRAFHRWCMFMAPSGFIAILAGWFVNEVGRQPWVAYGIMRTADAASPVSGQYVAMSLLAFIVVYTFVFGAGVFYIFHLLNKGPGTKEDTLLERGREKAPFAADGKEGNEEGY